LNEICNFLNIGMTKILVGDDFVADQLLQFLDFRKSTFGGTVKD
jgi:hypothetical protein